VAAADVRGASANTLSMVVNTATNSAATGVVTVNASVYSNLADIVTRLDTALDTAFGRVQGDTSVSDIDAMVWNDNQIRVHSNDEGSAYSIQVRTIAADTGNAQNVLGITGDTLANTGTDALIAFDGYTNTVDMVKYGSTWDTSLINKADGETGQGRVETTIATAPNGINLGNLLLDVSAARFDVRLDGGPANSVVAGIESTVYNADRSESLRLIYDLTSQGGTETINNVDQSLVFQIGANVGQTASIGLRNMSASSLGCGLDNMFRSLSEIDVTTVPGAQDAQSIIDAAINEVSTPRGTLGSFQKNTLESNLRNLRIAAQNLTASESQIRDTDMAWEMSEFTKYQILVQAGTAMLAQANQVPQVVLSLF
jgi:flagellin